MLRARISMGQKNVGPSTFACQLYWTPYHIFYPDPPKAELLAAFEQYGRENNGPGLKTEEQLVRLKSEFGLVIGCVPVLHFHSNSLLISFVLPQENNALCSMEICGS